MLAKMCPMPACRNAKVRSRQTWPSRTRLTSSSSQRPIRSGAFRVLVGLRQDLQQEHGDVNADQPAAHEAAGQERIEDARALVAVVVAILNPHRRPRETGGERFYPFYHILPRSEKSRLAKFFRRAVTERDWGAGGGIWSIRICGS